MFKLMREEKVTLQPKQAADMEALLNTYEGQRPKSEDHVQSLMRQHLDGLFREADIAIARKSFNGGAKVLVNGQHQLSMCALSGKPMPATIKYYDCPTPDDLWRLFGTFDGHRSRSDRHVINWARHTFSPKVREVPLAVLHSCASALVFLGDTTKPNFRARPGNRLRKTELLKEFEKDVLVVAAYYDTRRTRGLLTIPVVTAIIATHRANAAESRKFWERVLIGDALTRGTPQFNLREKLLLGGARAVGSVNGGKDSHQSIYNLCAAWWNAYRSGQPRQSVKVRSMREVLDLEK